MPDTNGATNFEAAIAQAVTRIAKNNFAIVLIAIYSLGKIATTLKDMPADIRPVIVTIAWMITGVASFAVFAELILESIERLWLRKDLGNNGNEAKAGTVTP